MPIYKLSPSFYSGFLAYFNRNSSDGVIGRNELRAALSRTGVKATGAEVQQMIDSISVDTRGITFQGFIDYVASYQKLRDVEHEYLEAFRLFDRSGSGELSRNDIEYVMQKLGLKLDLNQLFEKYGGGLEGNIDYDGFCKMMDTNL